MPRVPSSTGAFPVLALGVKGERVRALQRRLKALDFAVGPPTGTFDMKTVDAVKAFQRSRKLVADGLVGPKTWKALGLDALDALPASPPQAKPNPTRPVSPSAKPQARLLFDGATLCWIWEDAHFAPICWKGVSGRSGHQTKEFQKESAKGPLPEGEWTVAQGQYQQMPERNWVEKLANGVGRGAWPGGEGSWGKHRIWLTPKPGTQTYGRSGFSIHGGDVPGSAGCIDLTDQLEGFIHMFREYGQDMDLTVKYE